MLKNKTKCSFDLCDLTGASQAFFPGQRLAMLGKFEEVSCIGWQGSDGAPLWNGSCMANSTTPFWPAVGCGNQGTKHSLTCLRREAVLVNVHSKDVHPLEWMAQNTA
jgi:hypothetical protein